MQVLCTWLVLFITLLFTPPEKSRLEMYEPCATHMVLPDARQGMPFTQAVEQTNLTMHILREGEETMYCTWIAEDAAMTVSVQDGEIVTVVILE